MDKNYNSGTEAEKIGELLDLKESGVVEGTPSPYQAIVTVVLAILRESSE